MEILNKLLEEYDWQALETEYNETLLRRKDVCSLYESALEQNGTNKLLSQLEAQLASIDEKLERITAELMQRSAEIGDYEQEAAPANTPVMFVGVPA